ncbi:serine carboxypeptidase-like 45 [Cryptomeria japonica]|uniref:serine carboxypeptidase-like 45 n=1 Tax=Cryptomeria japonica TaxID=3369 RepID=UPI0027DA761B|nr:serine carboxypeptidase-like 45 [Cryptomeria japonica]
MFFEMLRVGILLSLITVQVTLSAHESDLINKLPGQKQDIVSKQYGGYITTDEDNGRALFYYFVQAETNPTSRPLALWLNGGPGCSSLGYGAFMEHGPFRPKGSVLENNMYSWNLEANLLYVESPLGVGFSYSNTSSDYEYQNDTLTAEDNLKFLLNWYEKFPEFKDVDFYITGESYGGHYVPQLAILVLDYNKSPNITPIKLKGIAIGNPLLEMEISINNGEFLWSHGLISDQTYQLDQDVCNTSRMWLEDYVIGKESQACIDVYNRENGEIGSVNNYDVILGNCLAAQADHAVQTTASGKLGKLQKKIKENFDFADPCIEDEIYSYFNREDVQKALHANTTGLSYPWTMCQSQRATLHYDEGNRAISILPVLSDLLKSGLPIMLFSGDQDAVVPFTATRTIANNLAKQLELLTLIPYKTWYDQQQVAGWTQAYGHLVEGKNQTILTFASVRGAAHEVPYTSPSQGLTLFRTFIRGLSLPTR